MTSLIQIQVWNKMLITFRDKTWPAGQQVSCCTLSEDNYYNVGSNTSKTGPWSDVKRQTRPAIQSLASNVCRGCASLSLITGLARLILEDSDLWAHVTVSVWQTGDKYREKIFWLRVNTDWGIFTFQCGHLTPSLSWLLLPTGLPRLHRWYLSSPGSVVNHFCGKTFD